MDNQDYSTSILIDQNPQEVYAAINHVRGWWSEEIEGTTDELNKEWFYHYKDIHLCKIKVIGLQPGHRVVWEVLENKFNFIQDEKEWIGNQLVFEITKEGPKTRLTFTQKGLNDSYECYQVCNNSWD